MTLGAIAISGEWASLSWGTASSDADGLVLSPVIGAEIVSTCGFGAVIPPEDFGGAFCDVIAPIELQGLSSKSAVSVSGMIRRSMAVVKRRVA